MEEIQREITPIFTTLPINWWKSSTLTRDAIAADNLYAGGNNPVNFIDENGRFLTLIGYYAARALIGGTVSAFATVYTDLLFYSKFDRANMKSAFVNGAIGGMTTDPLIGGVAGLLTYAKRQKENNEEVTYLGMVTATTVGALPLDFLPQAAQDTVGVFAKDAYNALVRSSSTNIGSNSIDYISQMLYRGIGSSKKFVKDSIVKMSNLFNGPKQPSLVSDNLLLP